MATSYYQRAGKPKKLVGLAKSAGDRLLPMGPLHEGPWWVLHARAAQVAAQADLIHDHAAAQLLDDLTDLATRGLAGELADSPTQSLTIQAVKSACALASRSTQEQASHLLGLLAPEVPRESGHYRHIDDEHAAACADIASTHEELAAAALTRLFDLADQGVQKASNLIAEDTVLRLLRAGSHLDASAEQAVTSSSLTEEQRGELRNKAVDLVTEERYLADVILAELDPGHESVREQAAHARDRILWRPDPDPQRVGFGTRMVSDSFLAGFLDEEDRKKCLAKLLEVAGDPREAAFNRQDALTGARNLVIRLPVKDKAATFQFSKAFVHGERDGSHLDAEVTGRPHPLSSFQISSASASLRGHGMYLAAASSTVLAEREWVRDRALDFLHSDDESLVQAAAVTLSAIGRDVTGDIDLNLLATHQHTGVRQASVVLCIQHVERHQELAMRLAHDSDVRVRRTLAEAAADVPTERAASAAAILEILRQDVRHSVRAAALQ
ncbi:HEAT repeat domain-containing protein [Streptomyces jumonjinensis]